MSIDDRIREQLEKENQLLKAQISRDPNLWSMLAGAYKGRLGGWMVLMTVIAFVLSMLIFWCGYQFFFVDANLESKLHWGIGLLLVSMMQIAIKMWTFNEMNRSSMQRELKKIELSIQELKQTVNGRNP